MSATTADATPMTVAAAMPRLDANAALAILLGGALATTLFDLYGQAVSPMLGFAKLAPVPLATQAWGVLFGAPSENGGTLLHYVAGLVAYPAGWALLWRPVQARVVALPWWLSATAYGVALWVFALFVMAHLVVGLPAFLGFSGISWVALVGHVLFALVAAAVMRPRLAAA